MQTPFFETQRNEYVGGTAGLALPPGCGGVPAGQGPGLLLGRKAGVEVAVEEVDVACVGGRPLGRGGAGMHLNESPPPQPTMTRWLSESG